MNKQYTTIALFIVLSRILKIIMVFLRAPFFSCQGYKTNQKKDDMYVHTHVLDNVIRITLFCVENMVKQYLEETRDHSLFNIAIANAACYSY